MFSLISYFAQRPFLARIVTIMVLMMGVISLYTLKLQEYPDVAFESVEVTTHYPGATASDVEVNVTNPLEKELRTVKGINFFFLSICGWLFCNRTGVSSRCRFHTSYARYSTSRR